MVRFDRNETSLIDKRVKDYVEHPRIGRVKEVYTHGAPGDKSNFEVDIDLTGDDEVDQRYVPVLSPGGNTTIDIPKVDDKVLVVYTEEKQKKPFVMATGWTTKDRPPFGRAGMWRRGWDSDTSPVGDGNLHLTAYTGYIPDTASASPENTSKYDIEPEETFIQIAKNPDGANIDPTDGTAGDGASLPFKFEIYDSPVAHKDDMQVTIEGNKIDQDKKLGMSVNMDFKEGTMTFKGENGNGVGEFHIEMDVKNETIEIKGDSDSDNKMGAQFDFSTDEFKIADGNQFGIKSDGSGNFTWDHKSINLNEVSGDTGGISL